MREETYNGYRNRETWAVALWIDNDEGLSQEVAQEAARIARSYAQDYLDMDMDWEVRKMAAWLENWLTELFSMVGECPGLVPMMQDVGSLWRVDWEELGRGYLEESTGR